MTTTPTEEHSNPAISKGTIPNPRIIWVWSTPIPIRIVDSHSFYSSRKRSESHSSPCRSWSGSGLDSVHCIYCFKEEHSLFLLTIVNSEATDGTRNAPVLTLGLPSDLLPATEKEEKGQHVGSVKGRGKESLYARTMGCQVRAVREMQ